MNETTIIIASTCERRRAETLHRAIDSVLSQAADARVLVVANGERVDAAVLGELEKRPRVRTVRLAEGSLPAALRHGRSLVDTPFFGFLDDDDEYLPDAIAIRLAAFASDAAIDAVATNGFTNIGGVDRVRHEHPDAAATDPLRALLRENWLASCGGLFRTDRVTVDFFDGVTRHYEWTVLGFKLAASRRVLYVDKPTFRVYDSPGSLSKSRAFRIAEPAVLEAIATQRELPADVRAELRRKIGRAHHGLSSMYLASGERRLAFRHHLASLAAPGGWTFLPFTRKLLPFWPRGAGVPRT